MIQTITLLIILAMIEIVYSPRLGWTRDKRLLLWYGRRRRDYIILI